MKRFDPNEKCYSVYVHIFPNGKLYIGSTRQVPIYRWRRGGGYKNCKTMSDAINEFGWDNIQHIVLFDGLDQSTAMEIEKALIQKYDTRNPENGYNTKSGGQFFNDHSEEFIDSLRERMLGNTYGVGRKMSESHRAALSRANLGHHRPSSFTGRKHTEETKRKISEQHKEMWKNPEYRAKIMAHRPDFSGKNNPRYGAVVSEETRKKISQANKGICRPSREHLERIWAMNSKAVICFGLDGTRIAEYPSAKAAAKAIGANPTNVTFCCKNPHRTCRGYKWRYKEVVDADRCGQGAEAREA